MHATTIPTQILRINISPLDKICPGIPSGIWLSKWFAPVKNEYVLHKQYVKSAHALIDLYVFSLNISFAFENPNAFW